MTIYQAIQVILHSMWKRNGYPESLEKRYSQASFALGLARFLGYEDCMLNFAGQDIQRGDFIGQTVRTNQGVKHRIGVVLGIVSVAPKGKEASPHAELRVVWWTVDHGVKEYAGTRAVQLEDGTVDPYFVFKLDPQTVSKKVTTKLGFALSKGKANYSA